MVGRCQSYFTIYLDAGIHCELLQMDTQLHHVSFFACASCRTLALPPVPDLNDVCLSLRIVTIGKGNEV